MCKIVVVVADLEISLSRKKQESDLKVVCWHEYLLDLDWNLQML